MSLHTVHRQNWHNGCGPTALAAITGLPYKRCVQELAFIKGRKFQGWTKTNDLHEAAVRLTRKNWTQSALRPRQALRHFLLTNTETGIVRVGQHFLAVDGPYVVDSTHTQGTVKDVQALPEKALRKQVTHTLFFQP